LAKAGDVCDVAHKVGSKLLHFFVAEDAARPALSDEVVDAPDTAGGTVGSDEVVDAPDTADVDQKAAKRVKAETMTALSIFFFMWTSPFMHSTASDRNPFGPSAIVAGLLRT
jgi:hypothetical protein